MRTYTTVILSLLAATAWGAAAGPSPSQAPSLSPSPSTTATPAALTEADKKSLRNEFSKALSNEEKTFNHLERSELRQLGAAQSAKQKSWHEQEKKARRAFFDAHLNGPERRQYVQDYLRRKEKFEQSQKDEAARARSDWKTKRDEMKKLQKVREAKFKEMLDRNERPDPALWQGLYH